MCRTTLVDVSFEEVSVYLEPSFCEVDSLILMLFNSNTHSAMLGCARALTKGILRLTMFIETGPSWTNLEKMIV